MSNNDMRSIIEEEFAEDPVYRLALQYNLKADLFTDSILSMHQESNYSTAEAGKLIDRADSTIRNHFRSDLIEYIKPEKFGKYYRLDFKSVFRLHMIFLLMEKASKTSVDILVELGFQPSQEYGNIRTVKRQDNRGLSIGGEDNQGLLNRLEALEESFNTQNVMLNILKYEKEITETKRLIDIKRSQIAAIKSESKMNYLEEKQARLLISSLKKNNEKSTFLSLFKKQDDVDVEQLSLSITSDLKEKFNKEAEDKIKPLEDEITSLEEQENKIKQLLSTEKEKFSGPQISSKSDAHLIETLTDK